MRSHLFFLVAALVILAIPTLATAGAADDAPVEPGDGELSLDFLAPQPQPMAGCNAQANCSWSAWTSPATVSCSSPSPGTCTSSTRWCGSVTCNGVTTKCPGACTGNPKCYWFCFEVFGHFDGACDTGSNCCVC